MAENSVVTGKIADIKVQVGSPEEIFGYGFNGYRKIAKTSTRWSSSVDGALKESEETLDTIEECKAATLKMTGLVENTRLPPYEKKPKFANLKESHLGADDELDFIVQKYKTSHPTTTEPTHVFAPIETESKIWTCFWGSNVVNVRLKSTATYREVAPERHPFAIRIMQDNTDPWVIGSLQSKDNALPNPNAVFEVEIKDPPAYQVEPMETSACFYTINDEGLTHLEFKNVKWSQRLFGFIIGAGTPSEIAIVFRDGHHLIAVRTSDGAIVYHSEGGHLNLSRSQLVRVELRWVPPGFYKLWTNILPKPFFIMFKKKEKNSKAGTKGQTREYPDPMHIPAAPIGYYFTGLGVHTFAYSPGRFPQRSVVFLNLPQAYDDRIFYDQAIYKDHILIPEDETGKPLVRLEPQVYHRRFDEADGQKAYYFYVKYIIHLEDDRVTPFFFQSDFTPALRPISPNAQDAPGIEGVKSITINPTIESLFKIRFSGEITLTNFNGEWDNAPQVQAVKISYRWLDHNSSGDSAGPYRTVFTGYMIKPTYTRRTVQEKYVKFILQDRWYALERNKIENSPFFDGTSFLEAVIQVLNGGGILDDDIYIGQKAREKFEKYQLAASPGFYFNPKFRFAFNTSYAQAIDTLFKTVRAFYYFTAKGKFCILHVDDVIADSEPKTFYARIEDIPSDKFNQEQYNVLTSYTYTKNTDTIHNWFVVMGYDWRSAFAKGNGSFTETVSAASVDPLSLYDPTYENYLGFKAPFYMAKTWVTSVNQAYYLANELRIRFSRPRADIAWTVPYYPAGLGLYAPVQFVDSQGSIPQNKTFWITGKSFNYDSKRLTITSSLQATDLQAILDNKLIDWFDQ